MSDVEERRDYLSASDIAALRLPGLPWSEQGVRHRARSEGWETIQERASGGRGGVRTLYALPSSVRALLPGDHGRSVRETTVRAAMPKKGRPKDRPLVKLVGERLKFARGGEPAERLARDLDVAVGALLAWEDGEVLPPPWAVTKLHLARAVSPLFLLCGIGGWHEPIQFLDKRTLRGAPVPEIFAALGAVAEDEFSAPGTKATRAEREDTIMIAYGMLDAAGVCDSLDRAAELDTTLLRDLLRIARALRRVVLRLR